MRPRELRSEYYHDRWSEDDLCHDFPGDEILIDGLHAMQRHFYHNGIYLEIPVVNVMNTAHFLAAYMFATTCSGDQLEYDALADMSLGRDKQMFRVTMIVLAAMLARTEGFRARQCRDLILENRDPDFEEGVTLYDRFLRSAEKRFAEEDFLVDTHTRIQQLTTQNEQLITENTQLKYQYRLMEEKYQQINIGTQNNNCTQIENQYNITYTVSTPTSAGHEACADNIGARPNIPLFKYIHPSVTSETERCQIHGEVQNLVQNLPLPEICRYLRKMYKDKRVYLNVKIDAMFAELHRLGLPDENTPGYSFKNFQNHFNMND